MPDSDDSLPRLLGARYRLEAKLGHGGMGVVYRATDLMIHRPVAIKLIRGETGVELDEEVAGRFLREAKNTARIQHEHIIEVFDLGRSDDGDLFFVMELLEGESLSARLRRDGPMPPETVVHIGRQICAALHVAHTAGIIHRDLKPANVMLLPRAGDDAFVKVLDFGVAKSSAPDQQTQLTATGMLVGTVEYMAPEQILGRTVDGRTDIYSLGVVLYRMLAGRPPFRDGGVPALIHSHLNVSPKPLAEVAPDVPAGLARVVARCLAKSPAARYATMSDLGSALAAALAPDTAGLMSLEYDAAEDPDPYLLGDRTAVAHPSPSRDFGDASPGGAGPSLEGYDDATLKMDRAPSRSGARRAPPGAPVVDRTEVLARDEVSTARRAAGDEIQRAQSAGPRECAMCRTINPPYARACAACGVSLAAPDQAAVRARVAPTSAPQNAVAYGPPGRIPPPNSGAFPTGGYGQPPAAPTESPSVWARLLAWAGLRGR